MFPNKGGQTQKGWDILLHKLNNNCNKKMCVTYLDNLSYLKTQIRFLNPYSTLNKWMSVWLVNDSWKNKSFIVFQICWTSARWSTSPGTWRTLVSPCTITVATPEISKSSPRVLELQSRSQFHQHLRATFGDLKDGLF